MKLSLDVNTTRFSMQLLGAVACGAGLLLATLALWKRALLYPAAILLLAGSALYGRKHQFIIRHPPAAVAAQIERTLQLLGWQYKRERDMIAVPAVGATLRIRPLASATLLGFSFGPGVGRRQEYLVKTLVKFQRHTAEEKE